MVVKRFSITKFEKNFRCKCARAVYLAIALCMFLEILVTMF